jgi:hypothetical protein
MNYSFEEPRPAYHCISFWDDEALRLAHLNEEHELQLNYDVFNWLDEHRDLHYGYLGGKSEVGLCYTIRFKTKDAALLFKLRFG